MRPRFGGSGTSRGGYAVFVAGLSLAGCDKLIGLDQITYSAEGSGASATAGPGQTASGTTSASASASGSGAGGCGGGCLPSLITIPGDGFAMTATEITYAEYAALVDTKNPPTQPAECTGNTDFLPRVAWSGQALPDDCMPPGDAKTTFEANVLAQGDYPVSCVDWCDAWSYCNFVGMRLCGARGGGPLPVASLKTAADDPATSEWFAACSHNGTQPYPYGQGPDDTACDPSPNMYVPHPVSSLPKCVGGFAGLFDLSENVEEWEDGCDGADNCLRRGGAARLGAPAGACALRAYDSTDPQQRSRIPRSTIDSQTGIRCCADVN